VISRLGYQGMIRRHFAVEFEDERGYPQQAQVPEVISFPSGQQVLRNYVSVSRPSTQIRGLYRRLPWLPKALKQARGLGKSFEIPYGESALYIHGADKSGFGIGRRGKISFSLGPRSEAGRMLPEDSGLVITHDIGGQIPEAVRPISPLDFIGRMNRRSSSGPDFSQLFRP
jgi:hypothetical protein